MRSDRRRSSLLEATDWLTVLLYLALVVTGIVMIRSTSGGDVDPAWFDWGASHGKQMMWFGISIVAIVLIFLIDPKVWAAFPVPIYIAVLLLLIGVLVFGQEIKGSKSWFVLGPVSFQPAELAKVGTALALAKWLSLIGIDLRRPIDQVRSFAIVGVPMALILLQGDVGSALVFASFLLVLHREGLPEIYLVTTVSVFVLSVFALLFDTFVLMAAYSIPVIMILFYNRKFITPNLNVAVLGIFLALSLILLHAFLPDMLFERVPKQVALLVYTSAFVVLGAVLDFSTVRAKFIPIAVLLAASAYTLTVDVTFNQVLKEHHRDRINVLLGKAGNDWNVRQSKIAIGSGRFTGKGYMEGTQTKLNFVPEQNTDFIFSTVGEEFGFLGSAVVLGLFAALLLRIVFLANRQRSVFTRVYGYSVASILLFHVFVNVGMTVGLAPVIGIPLPFISYGGSSLLAFSILLFLLVRMDTQRLDVL